MKNLSLTLLAVLVSCFAYAEESVAEPAPSMNKADISKISEAFGHLIGKNIESMGINFDMQYVVEGLRNAASGKESPMTEIECIQAISSVQEQVYKELSSRNLEEAEAFLAKNTQTDGVISLEEGKVQYKVEKEGSGESLQENDTPLVRYVGKFLTGEVFGSSTEDEPVSLNEIISGLKAGILGMKEGEKRTIYIHPDCAYGTKGALPPNSLLTFEVEVVKLSSPVNPDNTESSVQGELADCIQPTECVR